MFVVNYKGTIMLICDNDIAQQKYKWVLCDLDGTLVETNEANFLAYQEAIEAIMKIRIVQRDSRFTKDNIKDECPGISDEDYNDIVKYKSEVYVKYISRTFPNLEIIEHLKELSSHCQVILVSNSSSQRGNEVLLYHKLDNLFNVKYYNTSLDNKYKNVLSLYNIAAKDVLVFENDETDIRDALRTGILKEQIINVRWKR